MKFKIFYKEIEKSFNKIGGSNQLKDDHTVLQEENNKLKSELDKLKDVHTSLQEDYRKKLQENEKNNTEWEETYKDMQNSNNYFMERINNKNIELMNEIQKLKQEYILKEKYTVLQEENNKLKSQLDKLKDDHTLLQEENNNLKSELDKLKNDHTVLQEENNNLKSKLDKLNDYHTSLQEDYRKKIEENEKNNSDWEQNYKDMENSNKYFMERINNKNIKLMNEIDKLKQDINNLKK